MSRKEIMSVNLEPRQLSALRAITESTHVPTAELIRQAVDEWLMRYTTKERLRVALELEAEGRQ